MNWLAVVVYGVTIVQLVRLMRPKGVSVWEISLCIVVALVCAVWGFISDMRSFVPPLIGSVAMFVLIICIVIPHSRGKDSR